MQETLSAIQLEHPNIADGKHLYHLVEASPPLELNSPYYYLIYCSLYAASSVVAKNTNQELVAGLTGMPVPGQRKTLFIWQIAVEEAYRGQGLGKRLIKHALKKGRFEYLLATVTPGNEPSLNLFKRVADELHAEIVESAYFDSEHFPAGHEPENLLQIGPINYRRIS